MAGARPPRVMDAVFRSWSLFVRQWRDLENVRVVPWSGLSEGTLSVGKGWSQHYSFTEMLRHVVKAEARGLKKKLLRRTLDQTERPSCLWGGGYGRI